VSRAATFDRAVVALAALACLAFVVGLSDLRLPRATGGGPFALPPPAAAGARDARLVLSVIAADTRAPIGGATARAFWQQGDRYYSAAEGESDAHGTLVLSRLPRGALWVIVDAPGRARSSTRLVLEGIERRATVRLAPAHALTVSVRDERGAPLGGATVLVTGVDPLPFGALTGASGAARFTRLDAAPWQVKASARGYASATESDVNGDVTLTLRPLGVLDVRVVDPSNKPVPGATVLIAGSSLWPARLAETGPRGAARIAALLAGVYDLKAEKGDLVSDTLLGFSLARSAHESVTLRLGPGREVHVLVTDGDGDPPIGVPKADVVLAENGISSFPLTGRTGDDGSVTLGPIAPGPAVVAARAADFVPRGGVTVPDVLNGPVRVALLHGATLKGDVVDLSGQPIEDASIEVIGTDANGQPISETPEYMAFRQANFQWALSGPVPLIPAGELGVMPGPVPPIPPPGGFVGVAAGAPLFPGGSAPGSQTLEPWVTSFDGTFSAHPVSPGRVLALVRHPDYVEATSQLVTLAPGGEATVHVVMKAGGTLEGDVIDDDDQPVAGARVDLVQVKGTLQTSTLTANDGTFAFAAVPDDVMISVARPPDLSELVLERELHVGEGEHAKIELKLPAPRDPVRVVVSDEDDQAVTGAQVTVLSLDPETPLRRTLFTAMDGSVSVPNAHGLALRLQIDATGWARQAESVASAPEEIDVTLHHGVLVDGRVTDSRGYENLAGASITLVSDGQRLTALTDDQGAYTIRGVSAGPARLIVAHPDYATSRTNVTVQATGRADRPFDLPTVSLEEPASIEGDVVDAQGQPVRGARVGIGMMPAYLPAGGLPAGVVQTDAAGHFKLTDVEPGKVDVGAFAAGYGRGMARGVAASAGGTTSDVHIQLRSEAPAEPPLGRASVAVTLGASGTGAQPEVVIVEVAPSSEAERAGLKVGDVIEKIDGAEPASMRDARERLSGPVNSDVVIELGRGDATLTRRVAREPVRQ
jgi:Carboxypeptidase regulatory-like domain/PDZ domain